MTAKKITIPAAPKVPAEATGKAVQKFVERPANEVNPGFQAPEIPTQEQIQQFRLEIPASLHMFLKMYCITKRKSMKDEIIPVIEAHARSLGYVPPAQ